jgi:putative DNA primase/helicase
MNLRQLAEEAYLARHPENADHVNFDGDIGDVGDKNAESSIHAGFNDSNLSPNEKNEVGTDGDKSPFRVIEYQKGRRNGVYYIEKTDSGELSYTWLCDPLKVLAETRDQNQSNWGRLLSWRDNDGHEHIWACPAELLQSTDQSEFRKILAGGGLIISTNSKARKLLCDYVLTYRPDKKARCVDRIGWNGDRYVFNSKVIGSKDDGDLVVYQGAASADFSESGTLEEWKTSIAAMATGNSRMIFSISCSFAGVLTELAGETGGGFQFTGQTSKGKTSTLIDPAASVWGHPDSFAKKWRTTTNGLEALCLARNNNILILDDLGQIDPREAGQAAYLIANGQGKQRMSKEAYARQLIVWKTLLLSSGEIDLSQHIETTGKKAKGGQAARLPSIPCDTGSGWHTLENLHGCNDGAEFSRKIKSLTRSYYGTAGVAFLEKLANDYSAIERDIKESIIAIVKGLNLPTNHPPEVGRVAERFALAAYSGELATEYGVTGWKAGSSLAATKRCFDDWLAQIGGNIGHDDKALLNQVAAYLQTYGGSRFPAHDADPDELAKVHSRSGFTRSEGGEIQYLVESQAFKSELCKGFDLKYAIATLVDRGWLIPGNERKQQKPRIPALNKTVWVYVLTSAAIEGEDL